MRGLGKKSSHITGRGSCSVPVLNRVGHWGIVAQPSNESHEESSRQSRDAEWHALLARLRETRAASHELRAESRNRRFASLLLRVLMLKRQKRELH
jgi:hypothetical protein